MARNHFWAGQNGVMRRVSFAAEEEEEAAAAPEVEVDRQRRRRKWEARNKDQAELRNPHDEQFRS